MMNTLNHDDETKFHQTGKQNNRLEQVKSIESFLFSLIWPYAEYFPEAHLEIRCLGQYPNSQWFRPTKSPDAAAYAVRESRKRDVYMGVLPRIRGKRGGESLRYAAYLWCDVDGGDGTPQEALALLKSSCQEKGLPAPNLLVRSGGGCHAYWRLAFPVPVTSREEQQVFSTVLRRIVRAIGGDPDLTGPHACPKATDAPRILRVPGTFNHKNGQMRPVVLLRQRLNDNVQPLIWWKAHLPPEPVPTRARPVANTFARQHFHRGNPNRAPALFPATVQKMLHRPSDGEKHYAMIRIAVAARKQGFEETEISMVLHSTAVQWGLPETIDETRHHDRIVTWVMQNIQPESILC